jgi:hypothetical protein
VSGDQYCQLFLSTLDAWPNAKGWLSLRARTIFRSILFLLF